MVLAAVVATGHALIARDPAFPTHTMAGDSYQMIATVCSAGAAITGNRTITAVGESLAGVSLNQSYTVVAGTAPLLSQSIAPILPDTDGDGDADLRDFMAYQHCFAGTGIAVDFEACGISLHDGDMDLDTSDFRLFVPRMTGPR